MASSQSPKLLKPVVFAFCLLPLMLLAYKGLSGNLGANPIEVITHSTGLWTLIFLLITLAITPVRKITGLLWLVQYRRMLGLFAFFYGVLHFTTYIWLDKFFDLNDIAKDVVKRPFITVGFTAFVLLTPLAITSTKGWIRRLGGKNWQRLHRLVYVAALAGAVHFYWLVKKDVRRPVLYGTILLMLLLYRAVAAAAQRLDAMKTTQLRPRSAEQQ